ncbi:FtsK/SpoIIIE domain-containing protein [Actinoplanes sp. N902-109]|uniref:FtsK/SpoIIIE domain-containing protein n=1 Tax=Actinoplanes sp. (strain N902-109) TaxID=649831 RepID=UPI0003294BB6|nr:FtsK/SpoIIIE domain-containing protein [Actinoplanes sp. N902-109]AGL20560.1 cell division FtsK/SpoIIIE [Actinoplanes sp. N902-109]
MGSRSNALVAVVRQELAEARGTARAVLAAAESARSEAQRRKKLIREAYATCLAQLAEARDAARQDILRRTHAEATTLTRNVASLAALSAPGAAGTAWRYWTPTEPDRVGRPGLLRIGTVAYAAGEDRTKLPALVPFLDHAHLNVLGSRPDADEVISGLLLRALGTTRPGDVRLSIYDPEHLGGTLAGFAPLGNAGLLQFVSPGGLSAVLDDLVEHICRVNESVLAGEYSSLAELTAATTGPRPEPWRIVVLLLDPGGGDLTDAQSAQLMRIVRTGVACGVHLVVRGRELAPHPTVERIVTHDGTATCDTTGRLEVSLDAAPPADRIAGFCRTTAERLRAGPPPARFADLEPAKLWTESSVTGLTAPIGDSTDGSLVPVLLGDDPPHALIGGPSGSGKTNLIYAWIGSLTARYSPGELALYLLDFKEGVSFARFAPGPRDASWLPHVRLAGVNVNGDREFGIALLRHLAEELRTRAQAAKRFEATKLAELRAEDPDGDWPRIVAVIDEFQVLLAGRDALADEAVALLEDLARRGRSQGIHLVLASQDVSGIEALWGRSGLISQFTLRIALPKARRILAENNLAAAVIPRFHAVVNADSGVAGANTVVRLPDAGDRSAWRALQRKLWGKRPASCEPPRLFDGDAVPRLPAMYRPAGRVPDRSSDVGSSPGAVLGERIDVAARPARLRLGRMPGRNLAVLGTRTDEACDVLAAAALSLAAQGPARFSIACLDPGAERATARLMAELPRADWYARADLDDLFATLAPDGIPHYVLGYALDAAGPAYRDRLRALLADGPEQRLHVLGWWRSVPRLRDDLGGVGARLDTIGAWVALDVQGPELSPLSPQPGGPTWYPRRRRALFFDRSVHRTPEVIIPYEVNSDHT